MTTWLWLVVGGCQKTTPPEASASAEAPAQATATPTYALGPDASPLLLDPSHPTGPAPVSYDVRLQTSEGDVVLTVLRAWSPHAADRFYHLVRAGFYDQSAFFRTIDGFVAQFGLAANPEVNRAWRDATMPDDPPVLSNTRGRVTFAMRGVPDSRTTQLFINLGDNGSLDRLGFAPFAEVTMGMDVVDALHRTGEGAPRGPGPSQSDIRDKGNAAIDTAFPEIDRILRATVVESGEEP
ncbi:MAG: peptidylprolyl isomerase [Myxococcota bacterium]